MFDKLSCILCLEKAHNTSDRINIDTDDAEAVNARVIIEQHFKEELSMMSYFPTKVVCNQCWELVQSFHEFFIRVQSAHLAAMNALKSLQELEITVTEIKEEPGVIDELASPPKRRRGRPRLQKEIKNLEREPIALKECCPRVDLLTSPNNTVNNDRQQGMSIENVKIKSEDELNFSDDGSQAPMSDILSKREDVLPSSSPQKKKTPILVNRVKKNIEKEKSSKPRHKTSDYDKYIAENFELVCCLCQESLTDFRELKIHFRQQHQMNGYVKCCGKKLLKRSLLVDHIHFHNNPEHFKCPQCEKLLSDRRGLGEHIQYFHGSKERTFNCDVCSKGFFRREVLARHYLLHAPDEQKTVKCTQCEKTFCNEYNMKQHLKLVHLHSWSKVCDICGKSVNNGEAFRRHQQEHLGLPKTMIKCDLCDTEVTTKYILARHIKEMHNEKHQTPKVCPICSKVSPTLRAHHTHFKYIHATERKHACKLCDKAFKRPNDLREHMTTHTGEVLYTCTFCPQTFNSNANMYAHRKRKHPKEWAEKCAKKKTSIGMREQIQNDLKSIIASAEADEQK